MLVIFLFITLFLLSGSIVKAQIIVSEVLPKPLTDNSEWVELFNAGEEAISLSNWQLWDQLSKPNMIFQFKEEIIETNEYLIIELKNVLNNSGDSVVLYDDQQNIIDSLSYDSSKENISWSKNESNFEEILETPPSPMEKNLISTPTNEPIPTLTIKPNPTNIPQAIPTPRPTIGLEEPQKETIYPNSIIKPEIDLPTEENRVLQSIFFEPPNLERGAISVIMGSLLLLIPGLVYAKKQKLF